MKSVDLTQFFKKCGLDIGYIEILETEGMYPFNPDFMANWVYFTFLGYQRLRDILIEESNSPETFACVAAGSGVEVIGLARIFPCIERFFVTDIDSDVMSGCSTNVSKILNWGIRVFPLIGSLCNPLRPYAGELDLIHGNIPNLPCSDEKDLSSGDDKGTFIKQKDLGAVPSDYSAWGLESQYAYLRGAYEVLRKGGSVVTLLGGRFPLNLTDELFKRCGLELMPEFSVGFKYQTQPEIDYVGYHEIEKRYGIEFDFFRYEEALGILKGNKILNPTFKHSGQEIKDMLRNARVSAGEALELHKKGIRCGHTVHLFRGRKN